METITFDEAPLLWEALGEHMREAKMGVIEALLCFVLDWLLSLWMKRILVVLYIASTFNDSLTAVQAQISAQSLAMFSIWMALGVVLSFLVPARRCLVLSAGLLRHGRGCGTAWIQAMKCDDSDMKEYKEWCNWWNTAIIYVLTAYVLANLSWLCSILWWLTVRVMFIWLLALWTDWSELLVAGGFRILGFVVLLTAKAVPAATDWYEVLKAVLLDLVPQTIQRTWSRYQQLQGRGLEDQYQYQALIQGEIRLLVLKRTRCLFPSVITASLVNVPGFVSSEGTPIYEAVSYRWGSEARTDEILVDGKRFCVTRSAFDLLLARRSVWRERTIWIDAICIDQSNNEEKTQQVLLMADIYRRASRVIVFLGSDWQARFGVQELICRLAYPRMRYETTKNRYSPQWWALMRLLTNGYFNRVWIIQEVVAGMQVEVYCGGYYIKWEHVSRVTRFLLDSDQRYRTMQTADHEKLRWITSNTFENILGISLLKSENESNAYHSQEQSLERLLFGTLSFDAKDPRDKLFALFGLARHDVASNLVKPDYTKRIEQVFEDLARYLFLEKENASLHLLALAGIGFSTLRMSVPSWVPDLTEKRELYPYIIPQYQERGMFCPYSASGTTIAEISEGPLRATLVVRGILVDKVLVLSTAGAFNSGIHQNEEIDVVKMGCQKYAVAKAAVELIVEHIDLWPSNREIAQPLLWRALVGDRVCQQSPAHPKFENIFYYWLRFMKLIVEAAKSRSSPSDEPNIRLSPRSSQVFDAGSHKPYDEAVTQACSGRCFAITEAGRLCLVPPLSRAEDFVFIPFGAPTPFVIRKKTQSVVVDTYELVGDAYVQGLMYGEAILDPDRIEGRIVLA